MPPILHGKVLAVIEMCVHKVQLPRNLIVSLGKFDRHFEPIYLKYENHRNLIKNLFRH